MTTLNSFAAENRWVFYPIVGAVIMLLTGIRSLGGIQRLREGNHPAQAVIVMICLGVLVGFFMAWVTKVLFH